MNRTKLGIIAVTLITAVSLNPHMASGRDTLKRPTPKSASKKSSKPVSLKVGDKAPAFAATKSDGEAWSSSDIVGKKIVVIYFYPAAMTGGCTYQACTYRDKRDELKKLGAAVIGVSGDNPEGLALFKKANKLSFTLLSDGKGTIASKFGVPYHAGKQSLKRKIDGEEKILIRNTTTSRWTFIIDKAGKIAYINKKVNAGKDYKEVAAKLRSLVK